MCVVPLNCVFLTGFCVSKVKFRNFVDNCVVLPASLTDAFLFFNNLIPIAPVLLTHLPDLGLSILSFSHFFIIFFVIFFFFYYIKYKNIKISKNIPDF